MWRVKVCGLTTIGDAEFAWEEGADALGFVLEPRSPRCLTDFSVLSFAMEGVKRVAVFGEFFEGEDLSRFDAVQAIGVSQIAGKKWLPVFRPQPGQRVDEWLAATEGWEWCQLDPFHKSLGGGTGDTVDWLLAAKFVKEFRGKVILAGGLTSENVVEAIEKVRPFGVDASSGLEMVPGLKDHGKTAAYIREAWEALSRVHGRSVDDLRFEAETF